MERIGKRAYLCSMEQKTYFFAVDLGATSGRTIIGTINNGKFALEEVTRFPNNLIEQGGHYYWDIYALYFEIIRGLKEVAQRGLKITSIGIDTWGVDFVTIPELQLDLPALRHEARGQLSTEERQQDIVHTRCPELDAHR